MRALLFLARVALICNIFFLACLYLRHVGNIATPQGLNGFLIIVGWVMSPALNLVVNVWRANLLVLRKPSPIPKWLAIINFLFLLFQIIYFFLS